MTACERPIRADARRNRDRLTAAAREVFGERGLEAPMDVIARRAGVGSGTLYRHFPTREELVTAVFVERVGEVIALADSALESEDPWEGFAMYVRGTCRLQAQDRGTAELVAFGSQGSELQSLRDRAYDGVRELISRAKGDGALRADFTPDDFLLLLIAVAEIVRRAGSVAAVATERYVAFALDGFRAEGATPAPAAPEPGEIMAALREAGRLRGNVLGE